MNDLTLISKYFELTEMQSKQFSMLPELYKDWNEKINVISRKDIDNLMLHHVLHSLAIAKYILFKPGTTILDIGTGGGFPGIPLAILFPDSDFILVDSIGKKIKVVEAITTAIDLKNVKAFHSRAEQINGKFDFVVSRATAPLTDLLSWSKGKFNPNSRHHIYNGVICFKGGNLTEELAQFKNQVELVPVNQYFTEIYFDDKYVVHCPVF